MFHISESFKLIFISLTILVLAGCGVDAESNEKSKEVETGLTDEYHSSTEWFISGYAEDIEPIFTAIKTFDVNSNNREDLIRQTNEIILDMQTMSFEPVTLEDELYHEYFEDLYYDMGNFLEYSLKYLQNDDKVYRNMLMDSFDEIRLHLDTLITFEEKYGK